MKYDLTHLAMVGEDGIPVFLIPSATPDDKLNERRKTERADILRAVNSHAALLEATHRLLIVCNQLAYGQGRTSRDMAIRHLEETVKKAEGK